MPTPAYLPPSYSIIDDSARLPSSYCDDVMTNGNTGFVRITTENGGRAIRLGIHEGGAFRARASMELTLSEVADMISALKNVIDTAHGR